MLRVYWHWRILHIGTEPEVGIAMRFVCGFGRFGKELRSVLVDFVRQLLTQCRVVHAYK